MMITAHSGCDGTAANSETYIIYALNSIADAVEVDVRLQGGELILSHDADCDNPFTLRAAFLLLREFPNKKMNCDLKEQDLEEAVYRLAEEIGVQNRLIFTGDVNREFFLKENPRFPNVQWFANYNAVTENADLDAMSTACRKEFLLHALHETTKYHAAGINWSLADADLVWAEAEQLGVPISVWTARSVDDLKKYIAKKPANLTSVLIADAQPVLVD